MQCNAMQCDAMRDETMRDDTTKMILLQRETYMNCHDPAASWIILMGVVVHGRGHNCYGDLEIIIPAVGS